jgi:hypothetical protein
MSPRLPAPLLPAVAGSLLVLLLPSAGFGQPVEEIANGGFETGDFTGWTVTNSGSGNWQINDGTFVPPGSPGAMPPIAGAFDAVSFQPGPGLHVLSQTITLPSDIGLATLRWLDRVENRAPVFSDPNQEWRVVIRDTSGILLHEVFSTNPGDPLEHLGPNDRQFDLTTLTQSLEGEDVVVSFEEQDNLSFFNATIDEVSLEIELDSDHDTILDGADVCAATTVPEAAPSSRLGVNRFALVDGDTVFDTTTPYGRGPAQSFTIVDTGGCSCEQIVEARGLGQGQARFGCSIGVMREWVESLNE